MRLRRAVGTATLACVFVLPACTSNEPPDPLTKKQERKGLSADVRLLAEEMVSAHPNLFHSIPKARFDAAVRQLEMTADSLDRDAFMIEVARLVASVSKEGRDGHTGLFIFDQSDELGLEMFPVRLYAFIDGVYVVDAMKPYEHLIGTRLASIGATPIDDVIEAVTPLISKDNPATVLSRLPWFLVWVEALQTARAIDGPDASMTFVSGRGEVTEEIASIDMESYVEWADIWHAMIPASLPSTSDALYLRNADRDLWMTYLRDEDAVYLQYNLTITPTETMAGRLQRTAREHPTAEIIVDLRHNPGGEVGTSEALGDAFARPPLRDREVILLVGRGTYSAAALFASRLIRTTDPVLVGEPSGAARSFYGDPVAVRLPESNILVEVAGLRWGRPESAGEPLSFRPDIAIELSSEDFFAGNDPALVAALAL